MTWRDPQFEWHAARAARWLLDATVISLAFVAAHLLRFDGWPPASALAAMFRLLPAVVVLRLLVNYWFGIPQRIWRYVGAHDALLFAESCAIPSAVLLAMRFVFAQRQFYAPTLAVPIGAIVIDYVLVVGGLLSLRLARRLQLEAHDRQGRPKAQQQQRVLLVGAGSAGLMALREIQTRPDLGLLAVAFVDDDPHKAETVIGGVRVVGATASLSRFIRDLRIQLVIITIAAPAQRLVKQVVADCSALGVPVRIVPGLYEILDSRIRVDRLRPVEIEDLLGRAVIDFQGWRQRTAPFHAGRVILITGAGGSIGSELCRQLLRLNPRALLLLDKDEFGIYEIERELKAHPARGAAELVPLVADLRDGARLAAIFRRHPPDIVLHAAAHKHVPLMELNPCEAVLNNVGGIQRLLEACAAFRLESFVLVSSDKAVNPTNVMGATKRVAEMLLQVDPLAGSPARCAAVRFGNVLGSRGSVIPLLREQLRRGGPLTLTHPDMIRYFMTINEAAQLIIEAGTMGHAGEIYVLDMGSPVRIADLARDMIRLSGMSEEEIEIRYVGIRPGEKLREELLISGEGIRPTGYEKIFSVPPLPVVPARVLAQVEALLDAARCGADTNVRAGLREMAIGYTAPVAEHAVGAAG